MRPGNIIFSLVHFFLVVGLVVSGTFFLIVHFFPQARFQVAEVLNRQEPIFLFLGGVHLLFALAVLVTLSRMHRKHYYRVDMAGHPVEVDEAVVKEIVENYWKGLFPNHPVSIGLFWHPKQKMEITAEIPGLSLEEHEPLVERIEKELGQIFAEQLGYKKEFFVSILLE